MRAKAPGWPLHRRTSRPGSIEWLIPTDGTGALHAPVALEMALRQADGTLSMLELLRGDGLA